MAYTDLDEVDRELAAHLKLLRDTLKPEDGTDLDTALCSVETFCVLAQINVQQHREFVAKFRDKVLYDKATGFMRWACNFGRIRAGAVFGSLSPDGYSRSSFMKHRDLVHRFVWLHVTGYWPTGVIDHINGNRQDNRWSNLRDTNYSINNKNQHRARFSNKTGLLGVSAKTGKDGRVRYMALIGSDHKTRYLGTFETAEQAHAAYLQAKQELHPDAHLSSVAAGLPVVRGAA